MKRLLCFDPRDQSIVVVSLHPTPNTTEQMILQTYTLTLGSEVNIILAQGDHTKALSNNYWEAVVVGIN